MQAFLLATAAALMLIGSASAQVGGDTRWTFNVLTIWHFRVSGSSTIKHEPYGVFTSRDACDIARAKKTAELDYGNYRQPHLLPDQPVYNVTETFGGGARSITREVPSGPIERMYVTDCAAEIIR